MFRPVRFLLVACLVLVAALVVGSSSAVARAAPEPTERQPVVFVHGYLGSASNWDSARAEFTAAGYRSDELFVFSYDWRQSNVATAAQLEIYIGHVVARSGWDRVDVVAHSMGSLASRHCMKFGRCADRVDAWVSLGGPNHGTWAAAACALVHRSCREMLPTSSFLAALNAGDETPGSVRYTTIRTPCDLVIWPSGSTALAGADNQRTGCFVSHRGLTSNSSVLARVRFAL